MPLTLTRTVSLVGAAFDLVALLVTAVVVLVVLAMDVDRYEWATGLVGRLIDSVVAFARRARRG